MKTRFLIILFASLMLSGLPGDVFAPPEFSPQEKFNAAHVILTGEIVSFSKPEAPPNMLSSLDTIYEVRVDKYIKNPQEQDVISVIARGGPDAEMGPRIGNVNFDVGEQVYLYLREDDSGLYRINPFTSYRIEIPCEPVPDELSHLTDNPSSWEFQTTDSNLNQKQVFAVNEEIIIRFDATNRNPTTQTLTYDLIVHDGERKNERAIFHTESLDITLPACVGHSILEWSFTPTQKGDYFVDIRDSNGHGIGFGFPVTEDGSKPSNFDDMPVESTPILKQYKLKIPEDELRCHKAGTTLAFKIDGKPACLTGSTLAKLLERGWVAEKRYEPLPGMNLSGEPSSSEIAFDAAHKFLDSSKTFTFDGTERNGGYGNLAYKDGSPPIYLLNGRFSTDTTGYGERINQEAYEIETRHSIILKIKGPDVIYAVIDNQWDEINQEFIAERSENFKDFEIRHQKFFVEENRDYHLRLDSRPGLMRITDTSNDTHYLVTHSEFEKFWQVVIENEFFDLPQSAKYCETCIIHSLKIESGGTHNTITWIEEGVLDVRVYNVISALEEITQNQDDGWPT